MRIGKIRWPPPLDPDDVDNANQQRSAHRLSSIFTGKGACRVCRRMLVQRRIQEEIHGNKKVNPEAAQESHSDETKLEHSPSSHPVPPAAKRPAVDQKTPSGRRSQLEERVVVSSTIDPPKKCLNIPADVISPAPEHAHDDHPHADEDVDDDVSTNEIVARNQSSKLDFHKTLTPMFVERARETDSMRLCSRIGKENFELRKKLFEHGDESSLAGKYLSYHIER